MINTIALTTAMTRLNDTRSWNARRGRIVSRRGGWRAKEGKIYLCGYSMLKDLVGDYSWFQVMVLNATGRLIDERLSRWLEAVYICISWPDSRIWCNQVSSFAGTMGAPAIAAVSAGLLASNARMYGIGPLKSISVFLASARTELQNNPDVETFLNTTAGAGGDAPWRVPGFIRPLARGDERVPAMDALSYGKMRYVRGPHIETAYRISDFLSDHISETINIGGFICAFLLDQDFAPEDISRVFTLLTNGGMHACYAESADSPRLGYLPLRCDDIEYTGPPSRKLGQQT